MNIVLGLGDAGWNRLTAVLNFGILNWPKRTWNSHSFSRNKTLQLVVQAAEFKFESKIKPLPVIWQSLLDCHFQKTIQDFNSWFNGRALLVTLMLGFGWSHLQEQTQGISKQVAVLLAATGSLEETLLPAYHSFDTDSVLESKRFQCFVNFGWWLQIFFSYEMKLWWNWLDLVTDQKAVLVAQLVTDQSCAHHLARSLGDESWK